MTKTVSFVSAAIAAVALATYIALPSADTIQATPHHVVLNADSTGLTWEKMSHNQRKEYMHEVVMPQMRDVFRKFDSTEFGEVKCMLCHGDGVKDQSFKMPNPKLPKLPKTPEGWKALNEKKPKWMKFMSETVKPQMAQLLGMKPFDPKTGKGLGCMECHTGE